VTFFLRLNSEALSGLKRTSHKLPFGNISPLSRSVEPHLGQASVFMRVMPCNAPNSAAGPRNSWRQNCHNSHPLYLRSGKTKTPRVAPAQPAISMRTQTEWKSSRKPIKTPKRIMPKMNRAICAAGTPGASGLWSSLINESPACNAAQAGQANDVGLSTETRSGRCLQPVRHYVNHLHDAQSAGRLGTPQSTTPPTWGRKTSSPTSCGRRGSECSQEQ